MARSCSSHRRPAEAPVRTPEAALTAVILATDGGRSQCVVVGLLDADHVPVALVVVDGAETAGTSTVLDVVLEGTRPFVASLFVAATGPSPALPDQALFAAVERQCEDAGVEFLEWFVPILGVWVAVGERRGRRAGW